MEDTSGRPERVRHPTRPPPVPKPAKRDLGLSADPRSIIVDGFLNGYGLWLWLVFDGHRHRVGLLGLANPVPTAAEKHDRWAEAEDQCAHAEAELKRRRCHRAHSEFTEEPMYGSAPRLTAGRSAKRMSTFELSPVATFDGDFGDASLEGLTVELRGFCDNNSLCCVHHVVSRHVRSDRDRWNLLGINGESRRISHTQQSAKFVA